MRSRCHQLYFRSNERFARLGWDPSNSRRGLSARLVCVRLNESHVQSASVFLQTLALAQSHCICCYVRLLSFNVRSHTVPCAVQADVPGVLILYLPHIATRCRVHITFRDFFHHLTVL